MNALSLYFIWLYTMSKWRLLTGRSTGSQIVPPEWCSDFDMVGELHEVAEILDARVAAALVEVADEGRAVGRREHRVLAADQHVAGGIARVLRELARRASPGSAGGTCRAACAPARPARPRRPPSRSRAPPGPRGTRCRSPRGSCRHSARSARGPLRRAPRRRDLARDVRDRLAGERRAGAALGVAGVAAAARGRLAATAVRPSWLSCRHRPGRIIVEYRESAGREVARLRHRLAHARHDRSMLRNL